MRLRADIQKQGKTRHLLWDTKDAVAIPVDRPVRAEIVEESGAALLLRLDARGDCVADTWHEDVAAAKSQAAFEYGIYDADWVRVS
jgi:hypothetical protein